jgi:hypothetical protein
MTPPAPVASGGAEALARRFGRAAFGPIRVEEHGITRAGVAWS